MEMTDLMRVLEDCINLKDLLRLYVINFLKVGD